MENINPNSILIYFGFIGVVVELLLGAVTGFDLLLIGLIFIVSGGVGMFTGSFNTSLISIAVLAFVYVFIGRKFIKEKLSIATKATNVDALIEKKGIVIKKITPENPGQVKVEGEIWRAESEREIDEGQVVVVKSVSGVTLKVH